MKHLRLLIGFLFFAGCTSLGNQGDFQLGRQALSRAEPENALTYFNRVTAVDSGYSTYSGPLRESVWTYVGRAHYNSGRYAEARAAFDRPLLQFNDEHVARLYRGLTLVRAPGSSVPPPATRNPFSLQEVTFALKEGVDPRRVATLARDRGVAFDLSRETETQLRNLGADGALLDEIRKIRVELNRRNRASDDQLNQAAKELRSALTGLSEFLNYIRANSIQGRFWDPGGDIRGKIQESQSLLGARQLNWDAIVATAETVGYQMTEEPERAQRDEQRGRR
ncbi:MAG: hypothetical protein FJ145_00660 [Deltaproteobacteria bacterium]|nr:hypothetical protein [Deltaproteobacteria bacterium]